MDHSEWPMLSSGCVAFIIIMFTVVLHFVLRNVRFGIQPAAVVRVSFAYIVLLFCRWFLCVRVVKPSVICWENVILVIV